MPSSAAIQPEPAPIDGPDAYCKGFDDGWLAVADGRADGLWFWSAWESDYLRGVRDGMEDARCS